MKTMLTALALAAALSTSALAQTPALQNSPSSSAAAPNAAQASAVQKIRQDLINVGFTDVKVVAESFVVQAKTKDGNPVLMTIGPHGMSVFEAMNSTSSNSSSSTTGSNTNPSPTSSSAGNTSKK